MPFWLSSGFGFKIHRPIARVARLWFIASLLDTEVLSGHVVQLLVWAALLLCLSPTTLPLKLYEYPESGLFYFCGCFIWIYACLCVQAHRAKYVHTYVHTRAFTTQTHCKEIKHKQKGKISLWKQPLMWRFPLSPSHCDKSPPSGKAHRKSHAAHRA